MQSLIRLAQKINFISEFMNQLLVNSFRLRMMVRIHLLTACGDLMLNWYPTMIPMTIHQFSKIRFQDICKSLVDDG